tara:strand:+ start:196 stop:1068 length:873 start_codon:yes stop_codon:yes gene_type:complete
MAYKFSKGSQVIGDLKAADDTQRDTQIDFGEDEIVFETSGSTRMHIANDTITTTIPIHISGSQIEGLRVAKGGSDYRAIVFEVDGVDNANISVSNAENFVIQNEMNGKDIQFWVNPNAGSSVQAMTIKESGKVGIGATSPDTALHVDGDIKATGNINAKLRHVKSVKYSKTNSNLQYVRWDAAGSNDNPGVNNKYLAPCDGELLSVIIRATSAANGTNIAFHKASNGTEDLNTTAVETVGVDMSAANTAYQVTFSSSTFSAGEVLGISVNPSSTPNDVNITCVFLFDWNS